MANLIEAFNDCVDRMNAGESIETCLRDYPEYAERLRQLLQMGELVYRAHDESTAASDAQSEVRSRVVQSYRNRKARTTNWGRWFFSLAAVASLVLVVGIVTLALLGPAVGNVFSNIVSALDTGYSSRSPVVVEVTTLFDGAPLSTAVADALTATAIPFDATAKPAVEVTPAAMVTTTPHLSATPTPASTVILGPILTAEPRETALPDIVGVIATSVVGMSPVPATDVTEEVLAYHTVTFTPTGTATTTPTGSPAPSATYAPGTPTMPPTPAPTQETGFQPQASATPIPLPEIIPLNAGEIDDNARWDTYLLYRANFLPQYGNAVHDVDVTGRQIIHVTDEQGLPVLGARVQVYTGRTLVSETLTYATGQTLFFPNARAESRGQQSFRVVVEKGNAAVAFTLDPQRGPVWDVTLEDTLALDRVRLDVLFLLDTTGSMGDELAQLQNNILGISAQIAALPGGIDVRYGLVTYRDRGDAYVTRTYDFTPDVGMFQASLNGERADGGGDEPESLNQALHDAINNMSWRGEDTVKLVFLVADAPPHLDYPQDYDYAQEMVVAAQRGIKIHPIASSGLNQVGEYIFRQIAQYTMGHFIFLTYQQGASGEPGVVRQDLNVGTSDDPTTQQDQGDYTVERLDDLVLRLITDELLALTIRATSGNPVMATKVDISAAPPVDFRPLIVAALVGVSFLVGYSFSLRKSFAEKRKRKNDEREADWTDRRL